MIKLTRLNGTPFMLNAGWIETVDAVPDTMITLSTGRKYVVREAPDDVRARCIEFFRSCGVGAHPSTFTDGGFARGGSAGAESSDGAAGERLEKLSG